ncbi:MAG TPA: excinuclease ABC subunit UvrA, partial [Polyangiaceae bacterium]|nr:excinuclease ABC subunit UvrA [Polyangiaceae bacterium]
APTAPEAAGPTTLADLEPYVAALFGAEAVPACPDCGVLAVASRAAETAGRLVEEHPGARAVVSYPVVLPDAEAFLALREALTADGYRRLVVGGVVRDLDEVRPSEATARDVRVGVVTDRVTLTGRDTRRVQQALEAAWERGAGRAEVRAETAAGPKVVQVGRGLVCPSCARAFEPARPALFSYNSPLGACAACRGFGRTIEVDWDKVFPDPSRSIAKGAVKAWSGKSADWERKEMLAFCKRRGIPVDAPWGTLTDAQRALIVEGEGHWDDGKFPGVRRWFTWLETRTYKMHVRVFLARYREYVACRECEGSRLNATARAYRVAGLSIGELHRLTVAELRAALAIYQPVTPQGARVREALLSRLGYLEDVGLGYLALDRQARTLSGGEAQRAGLTTALGASLTGALFVLDEPTVGLHALDVPPLARAMRKLADAGNTVLFVEHDAGAVRAADRVVELGPGAGLQGGEVLFDGTPAELARRLDVPTGRAWAARPKPRTPHKPAGFLELTGVRAHNLRGLDLRIPLGLMTALTGPSGSGKSTLAEDVLYRAVARACGDTKAPRPLEHAALRGAEAFTRAVLVDQSPLGRTARGNAGTYTKAWDRVRERFAAEPEARRLGLTAAHFSFNVAGKGRCEACSGEGYETVEMQFLADVSLLCPVCRGKRFQPEVLAVRHLGVNVAELLALPVADAKALLEQADEPGARDYVIARALEPLVRVGLGYVPIGQPLSTLSGGEAQRLKLARALGGPQRGTLYVVDEPSAGLHAEDVGRVVGALRALVDEGATVVVVEHDLDLVRACDHVVDLGPGGGPEGGQVVATGSPEELARTTTRTGLALAAAAAAAAKGARAAKAPARGAPKRPRPPSAITVVSAREHTLKDVSCTIPHGALTVVTGPSGSGKSSLAFDVIFAEGQRRFMETLTPYARQFLPTLPRADVDAVLGVPPSIALEQRTTRGGANSTVATVTEIAHYLRLLYAKVGDVHCPRCDTLVDVRTADELLAALAADPRPEVTVYAPAVAARKGLHREVFVQARRAGIMAARVDGAIVETDPPPALDKAREHTVDLIVHFGKPGAFAREAFDRALSLGNGALRVAAGKPTAKPRKDEAHLSTRRTCPACGEGVPELDPRWFSFNTQQGQCPTCEGTGAKGGPAAVELAASAGARPRPCPACEGTRLAPVPRRVRIFGETYPELSARSIDAARAAVSAWSFEGRRAALGEASRAELLRRLGFASEVGLGYLALGRPAATLSGGEMQRLRLSAQLGSGLTGALYVLDEPTIGLHPRDTAKLLTNLRKLVDTGSTVLVVEHDADVIRAADWVVDLGPGGGEHGGRVVASGRARDVLASAASPTGVALRAPFSRGREPRPAPAPRAFVELRGAREHNLKDVTLRVPHGRLTVVAGVSGSGKSTLVSRVFYPAVRAALGLVTPPPGAHGKLLGLGGITRAVAVDQAPIGRTPRSVPATFLGVWDEVRRLFASLPEAKARGFTAGRFSFNSASGGRCPACEGQGAIVHEMSFLPDVVSPCETCAGLRFEPATLDVKYKELSAGDVLRLSAAEAAAQFSAFRKIARPLAMLDALGVGYLRVGQGSNTLSGGEAQRLKLAAELTAGAGHTPTLYVLDEPTTGLHVSDVTRLLASLDTLVERGDTLVVIEHHPDVIRAADWVVELGPEAGEGGGQVVFEGPPATLLGAGTATARALRGRGR